MSISRVNLKITTRIDPELLEQDIPVRYIRLIAWLRLKTGNGWTVIYEAIVDTGNPITAIPFSIWSKARVSWLSERSIKLHGIGSTEQGSVQGRLGEITIVLLDERRVSIPLKIKAYLVENDSVPLLIGFEDVLTNLKLVSHYKSQAVYLEWPPLG